MRRSGATLIELLVVIGLVGVLASAVFLPLVTGIKLWRQILDRESAAVTGRLGIERIVREISWIRDDRSVLAATGNSLRFVSGLHTNETIQIDFVGSNIRLQRFNAAGSSIGGPYTLVSNVGGLSFLYFRRDGTTATPTVTAGGVTRNTDIWRIRVRFSIPTLLFYEEMVKPRSFLRSEK